MKKILSLSAAIAVMISGFSLTSCGKKLSSTEDTPELTYSIPSVGESAAKVDISNITGYYKMDAFHTMSKTIIVAFVYSQWISFFFGILVPLIGKVFMKRRCFVPILMSALIMATLESFSRIRETQRDMSRFPSTSIIILS